MNKQLKLVKLFYLLFFLNSINFFLKKKKLNENAFINLFFDIYFFFKKINFFNFNLVYSLFLFFYYYYFNFNLTKKKIIKFFSYNKFFNYKYLPMYCKYFFFLKLFPSLLTNFFFKIKNSFYSFENENLFKFFFNALKFYNFSVYIYSNIYILNFYFYLNSFIKKNLNFYYLIPRLYIMQHYKFLSFFYLNNIILICFISKNFLFFYFFFKNYFILNVILFFNNILIFGSTLSFFFNLLFISILKLLPLFFINSIFFPYFNFFWYKFYYKFCFFFRFSIGVTYSKSRFFNYKKTNNYYTGLKLNRNSLKLLSKYLFFYKLFFLKKFFFLSDEFISYFFLTYLDRLYFNPNNSVFFSLYALDFSFCYYNYFVNFFYKFFQFYFYIKFYFSKIIKTLDIYFTLKRNNLYISFKNYNKLLFYGSCGMCLSEFKSGNTFLMDASKVKVNKKKFKIIKFSKKHKVFVMHLFRNLSSKLRSYNWENNVYINKGKNLSFWHSHIYNFYSFTKIFWLFCFNLFFIKKKSFSNSYFFFLYCSSNLALFKIHKMHKKLISSEYSYFNYFFRFITFNSLNLIFKRFKNRFNTYGMFEEIELSNSCFPEYKTNIPISYSRVNFVSNILPDAFGAKSDKFYHYYKYSFFAQIPKFIDSDILDSDAFRFIKKAIANPLIPNKKVLSALNYLFNNKMMLVVLFVKDLNFPYGDGPTRKIRFRRKKKKNTYLKFC